MAEVADPIFKMAGVKFPATQSASADANTLDDYEEGTFTPGIAFGGAFVDGTYDTPRIGRYTKIGNRVFYSLLIILTSNGTSTGAVTITGLPFTSNATAGVWAAAAVHVDGLTSVSGMITALMFNNATIMSLRQTATGTAAALTEANVTDSASFAITGFYEV